MLKAHYTIKDFAPLIGMFALVILGATAWNYLEDGHIMRWMELFMGMFFILFGLLKASNLKNFVSAYRMYDILAMRSRTYAYAYPLIELGLGVLYVAALYPVVTNAVTLVVMTVSAWGVYRKLASGEPIMCACLGAVFKVPMTWVTLGEDLLMAIMAAAMLIVLI